MMNVLSVVSELKLGGGENRVLNLARAIDRTRFRHTVVTLYTPHPDAPGPKGTLLDRFADAGIEVHDLGVKPPRMFDGPRPVKVAHTAATLANVVARLGRLIVSSKADLVDAHLEAALYTGVLAATALRIPSTITLYSEVELWRIWSHGFHRALLPSVRRFNMRRCAGLLTDSPARADDFRRFLGAEAPPVHVIPNGVRLDPPRRSRAEILRALGIRPDTQATIIGQVAGLVPFKGQDVLLDAATRVVRTGHDVIVLCIGEARTGPAYSAELRQRAERLGISERVVIQSYLGNIADVWSVIDLHAHASRIDSMPNAIIEGMSVGKPAVVTAVGAVPEHVTDGHTGLVVPPDNAEALARALSRLLENREEAKRLGEAARARYEERFTPERTARRIERVFEEIIRTRRPRRSEAA